MSTYSSYDKFDLERIQLRFITDADLEIAFKLRSDLDILTYVDRAPITRIEDAQRFIDQMKEYIETDTSIYWLIELKSTGEIIGSICLWNFSDDRKKAEVGYGMFAPFHGKGYMSEALKFIIEFSRNELHVDLLEAFTHRENRPSIQLLERHGFYWQKERTDDGYPSNLVFTQLL